MAERIRGLRLASSQQKEPAVFEGQVSDHDLEKEKKKIEIERQSLIELDARLKEKTHELVKNTENFTFDFRRHDIKEHD